MASSAPVESLPRVSVEHIAINEKGQAHLAGHRIKVRHIVQAMRAEGYTAERLQAEAYPHLSLAQVYAALAYYHDHPQDIEHEIEEGHRIERELRPQLENPELAAKIRARAESR